MSDFYDLDDFFNGKKTLDNKTGDQLSVRAKILRFLKLAMPSVAAVLVAMVLLFPSLKKNTVVSDFDVTLPKKGELEKLHIEQTEFSMTDKDNKVSKFTADRIDETEAGSKLMKIINPKGKLPAGNDGQFVYVDSDIGYFNQAENYIQAKQNVKAVYDGGTTVLTEEADYNFNTQYGKGNQDIYAYGDWGKLWAQGFEVYQPQKLIILTGKSKIDSNGRKLWADKEVRYYKQENKIEALGNVVVSENNKVLHADRMIAYFKDSGLSDIEKIEAFGNVIVDTDDGQALGDYGLYIPQKAEVELHDNVVIKKDGSVIYGQKAITNLNTSISRIVSGQENKKRVSGIIKGKALKDNKHEKK